MLSPIAQLGERVVRNDEVGSSILPGSTTFRKPAGPATCGLFLWVPPIAGERRGRMPRAESARVVELVEAGRCLADQPGTGIAGACPERRRPPPAASRD